MKNIFKFRSFVFSLILAGLLSGCGAAPVDEVVSATDAPVVTQETTDTSVSQAAKTKNPNKKKNFRKPDYLTEHYKKHGIEMGYESEDAYLQGANDVINNPNALHKLEEEDDDHVYFIEATNEIVFLSQDGYIRTYFVCSGKDYFDRQ